MTTPYAACFFGAGPTGILAWGGAITSIGVWRTANRLRAIGIEAECFNYNQMELAELRLTAARNEKRPVGSLAYSLGNTAALWLQQYTPFNLVFSIADSELGRNYPINHTHTKRSVLWRGPGILSGAGGDLGYDVVHDSGKPHLLIHFAPEVWQDAVAEFSKLFAAV
jgi:hypothetical protein